MVAFLEKHFEFTTSLSIDQCVLQLKAQSTRKKGFFASRQEILVRISDDANGKTFVVDRDAGRNLYAEVHGQLSKNPDGSIHVSGFGQVSLFTFLFTLIFSLVVCLIIYKVPDFGFFGLLMIAVNLILLLLTFNNRNNLIYIVEMILGRKD